ncbi:MAG: bifunctional phosphoribosyl-AMP cyclohydrolase/phosphoribosyl-ATP diphosphatase HisIE [Euryarchaeota archaeon]|nr:bifunctional phosphoribosyl-AMP cyclohydrolase/phosphoribosyl-ATP diphosphatase HisIE [Euryarchaeota archaeon]
MARDAIATAVKWNALGEHLPPLVPVVAQDEATGAVLMLAWADKEALERSLDTGRMHYWSRSRRALWMKGETSGHIQEVSALYLDCDGDAVLARVRQTGPACHTGSATCFHEEEDPDGRIGDTLTALAALVRSRRREPRAGGYTDKLLADTNLRLKKVGEESGEFLVAAARDDRHQMVYEAADLLYHLVVALEGADVPFEAVLDALAERRK